MSIHDTYAKSQLNEIRKQLDNTNIRIISAMYKYGPRNLLEVSRRTGLPFTSVYHRVEKIESKSDAVALVMTPSSKLGIVRVAVLLTASSGCEDEVTRALKAPNIWRSVGLCEGTFTHISIQLVPVKYLKEFRSYIQRLVDTQLVTNFSIVYTGDYVANFPDFEYYDPAKCGWKFDWEEWLASLSKEHNDRTLDDPESYAILADEKDMAVLWQLEQNARRKFTDMAGPAGMHPDGVKYHYERLVTLGIADQIQFRVFPFPTEASAYHELMLEFNSDKDLERFFSLVPKLFFVVGAAKVLRQNVLMVQTFMLESQLRNMFSFFSAMGKAGFLKSYSSVRMDFASRQTQSISEELFSDENGWTVDFENCLSELPRVEKVRTSA